MGGRDPHAPTNDLEEGGEGELLNHYRRRGKREATKPAALKKILLLPSTPDHRRTTHERSRDKKVQNFFLCLTACCTLPPLPTQSRNGSFFVTDFYFIPLTDSGRPDRLPRSFEEG